MAHAGRRLPFVAAPPGDVTAVTAAAEKAAEHWRLPTPVHLRTGMNALFAAGEAVVLRVGRVTGLPAAALELLELLRRRGIRVPVPVRDEAVRTEQLTVFAIRREWPTGPVDWCEVGRYVSLLHRIDPEEVPAGYPRPWCGSFPWWEFGTLLDEVDDLLDPAARVGIRDALDRHGAWEARVGSRVLCHGDVHPGNVVQTAAGPMLLDWDLLCVGPPEWDHAPLMTWTERWGGEPGVYEAYAAGYGRSYRGDPLAASLAQLRLLAATLLRLRAGRGDDLARREATERLRWWRGEPDAPPWSAA